MTPSAPAPRGSHGWLDTHAISLSLACAAHGSLTPALVVALPALSTTLWIEREFHLRMLPLVLPILSVAILMATHDLFRAKQDATRVGIMRHGKLAHILSAAELRHTDLEKLYLETMAA